MKKIFILLCFTTLIFSGSTPLFAGGIINKQNFSAEYIRTVSRNAATDSSDIVFFNPAGVMKMENGLYGNAGIFYAQKDYSNTFSDGVKSESDEPSVVPMLVALYKQDKWAGFVSFGIPGGGGKVIYDGGTATTLPLGAIPLEAESIYFGHTLGGAYSINDMISLSAGLRYVDANKEATASGNGIIVDYEETADGWGGFLGVNIVPVEDVNVGLRFETNTKMDFKTKVKEDTINYLEDGSMAREDLPGLLALGVSYIIIPQLKADFSITYYLEKQADLDGLEDNIDNTYDFGLSLEYKINPKLKCSAGYLHTNAGMKADDMLPENPELDANTICGGIAYKILPELDLNFSLLNAFYKDATTSDGIKFKKNVLGIAIGIQYKFM